MNWNTNKKIDDYSFLTPPPPPLLEQFQSTPMYYVRNIAVAVKKKTINKSETRN